MPGLRAFEQAVVGDGQERLLSPRIRVARDTDVMHRMAPMPTKPFALAMLAMALCLEATADNSVLAFEKLLTPRFFVNSYGMQVAIDGSTVAVGSYAGGVFIYERERGGFGAWGETGFAHEARYPDRVVLDGDILAVGRRIDPAGPAGI